MGDGVSGQFSSEWVPPWVRFLRGHNIFIVRESHLLNAARLNMFRVDFDVNHMDRMISFLMDCGQDASKEQINRVSDWLLEVALTLLNPTQPASKRSTLELFPGSSAIVRRASQISHSFFDFANTAANPFFHSEQFKVHMINF